MVLLQQPSRLCTAIVSDFQVPFEFAGPIADIDLRAAYIRARHAAVFELWLSIAESDYLHITVPEEGQEGKPAKRPRTEIEEEASKHTLTKFAPQSVGL